MVPPPNARSEHDFTQKFAFRVENSLIPLPQNQQLSTLRGPPQQSMNVSHFWTIHVSCRGEKPSFTIPLSTFRGPSPKKSTNVSHFWASHASSRGEKPSFTIPLSTLRGPPTKSRNVSHCWVIHASRRSEKPCFTIPVLTLRGPTPQNQ